MPTSPDNPSSAADVVSCAHCGLPVAPALLARLTHSAQPVQPAFCCGGCRLVHSLLSSRHEDQAVSSAMLRIGLGIFFSMNLMAFSFSFYGAETLVPPGGETHADTALDNLFRWLLLLLASGVMLTLWMQIARSAWDDLRGGRLQTGLLIAIGSLAAYIVSAISVVRGIGPLYFDSASMVLLLVTVGQYLEAKMKTAAVRSAEGRLLNLPDEATIETPQGDRIAPVTEIRPGQTIRVAAGNAIAVDGEVTAGKAMVDASLLTGESEPQLCEPGASVWAGSHLIDGVLWIRATAASSQRRIESIVQQLHGLRYEPTHIQRLTDRAASIFIPATLVLALAVFAYQWLANDAPMPGVMRALAVALIACPCALGLAAPLVISCAAASLARQGIVVRSARALELAASIKRLFFDKTGTLTTGDFRIERTVRVDPTCDPTPIAAALQRASTHPVARAFAAADATPLPGVSQIDPVNGLGVRGIIDGALWFIGRPTTGVASAASAMRTTSVCPPPAELNDLLPVLLTRNDRPVAWFGLTESVRPESASVLDELRSMHIHPQVLTGDVSSRAAQLGTALGVDVRSGMTPESKRDAIRACQTASNAPVAFVGDGINDTLALAQADLGITVAGGSDLAHASGQVSLLDGDLHRLVWLLHTARIARRRIALALTWSFGYNTVGLVLAALGLLTPAFAAIAMVISSAITVTIASRRINVTPADHAHDLPPLPASPTPEASTARHATHKAHPA